MAQKPQNEQQFKILKQFASLPGATPAQVARHFHLTAIIVRAVQEAPTWEDYQSEPIDRNAMFDQLFGKGFSL